MQADSSVADLMPALVLVAVDTNLHTNRTEECKRAARGSGVLGGAPEAKGLLWVGFRQSASSPDVRFLQRNGSQLWTKSMLSRSPENHGTKACSSDRKRPLSSKKSGRCEFDCRSPAILGISLSLTWRIDLKLRACDLVKLRARDVCHGDRVAARTIVMQQKTQRSVQFEITEPTREAIATWINRASLRSEDHLFPSRLHGSQHLSTRQYARIVAAHQPETRCNRAHFAARARRNLLSFSIAALKALRADAEMFAAVITDERMPGMSGTALIREVRSIRRELPLVLVSGYLEEAEVAQAQEYGADQILRKPLLAIDLSTCLAR